MRGRLKAILYGCAEIACKVFVNPTRTNQMRVHRLVTRPVALASKGPDGGVESYADKRPLDGTDTHARRDMPAAEENSEGASRRTNRLLALTNM